VTDLLKLGQSVLQKQPFSAHLGTELVSFEPGRAVLALDVRPEFLQQHGFVHGGIISYLIDNALTFAGGSVLGVSVVTAEYKLNYIRPARGGRLIATATVEGSGSRLAVCRCEVTSVVDGKESRCAVGQGTIAVVNSTE
jgi:uncharacterized protein (TIGR00369 family)